MQNCKMTLDEAFLGVTYNAAKSILKSKHIGLVKNGYIADLIIWEINDLSEIPYWHDSANTKIKAVIKNGKIIS